MEGNFSEPRPDCQAQSEGSFCTAIALRPSASAGGLSWGIQISDLVYYVELGEQIVDQEVSLRRRITLPLSYDKDVTITIEMVKNARISRNYIIERLFQHRIATMRDLKEGK